MELSAQSQWPAGNSEMAARIRSHNWAATPLGPIATWSERLKIMVEQMLANPLVSTLVCGPERILVYNDVAAQHYGSRHPAALGNPLPETFPEGWLTVAPLYDRAFAGESVRITDQPLDTRGSGADDDVFDALLVPVRETDGQVAYVQMTGTERGKRWRAETALQDSEAKYRSLFEAMVEGFYYAEAIFDEQGRCVDLFYLDENPAAIRMIGQSAKGRRMSDLAPYEQHWRDIFGHTAKSGEPQRLERFAGFNGIWFDFFVFKPAHASGNEFAVVFNDATIRHRAIQTLRESEERQAFLLKLSDALRPLEDPVSVQTTAMMLLAERLNVMRATYFELEADQDAFHLTARFERNAAPIPEGMRLSDFSPALFGAYSSGRTLAVADTRAASEFVAYPETYLSQGVMAWAAVPLAKEGRLVAWIGVHSGTPRQWSSADLKILEDVAERTWAALDMAALQRRAEQRNALLVQFSEEVAALADAGLVAETACRLVAASLGAERAYWAEIDWKTREYVIGAAFHDLGVPTVAGRFPLDAWEPFTSYHVAGRPVVVNDTQDDARISPAMREGYSHIGVGADLAVGVAINAHLRATLAVNQRRPRFWTSEEVAFLQSIAGRCWAAVERARAEAALRASEERFRALVTAGGSSIYRMSPDWRLMYELDSDTLAVTAAPIEDWVERYIPPEDLPAVQAAIGAAIRGKSLFELEHRVWAADGDIAWVISRAVPLLGPDGEIFEWFGAGTVVTERKRAEEALRESEERYRSLFESMDEAYAVVEVLKDDAGRWADFRFIEVNPAFMVHTNMPYPVGQTATELLGTPNPRWTELYGQVIDTGETLRVEETEATLGITLDLNIFALDREQNRVAVLFTNITHRKQAEIALRESEERLRQFGEASQDVLWIRDAETLQWQYLTPAFKTIYGLDRDEALKGDNLHRWGELIHPDDREHALASIGRVREGEKVVFEYRVIRPVDGRVRWLRNTDFPMLGPDGQVGWIGGIGHDATEEKRSTERIRLLLGELQHRVRNTLAVVRSIVRRTAEASDTVEDFHMHLSGRISALARVQTAVTRDPGSGLDLEHLAAEELFAHAKPRGEQVTIKGPPIALQSKAAENLVLALHELAINAVKYGALAITGGRVRLTWTVTNASEPHLVLDWQESGVRDMPEEPTRTGFGTHLVEQVLSYELDAEVSRTFKPGGLHCVIDLPLAAVTQDGDTVNPAVRAALMEA